MLPQKFVLVIAHIENTSELFLYLFFSSVFLVNQLYLVVNLSYIVVLRSIGLFPAVGTNWICHIWISLFGSFHHLLSSFFNNTVQPEVAFSAIIAFVKIICNHSLFTIPLTLFYFVHLSITHLSFEYVCCAVLARVHTDLLGKRWSSWNGLWRIWR